jgi:hypothetical protein
MNPSIADTIKKRDKPKDVFITPKKLADFAISMIEYKSTDIWLDPFKNSGNYFNNFPSDYIDWCEILDGKDFFEYNKPVDIICSNPPYSCLDKVLAHSVSLRPRVIQYLIGFHNLTAKRIEFMEKNHYFIKKLHFCKVYKWFGMSVIVQFEKGADSIISYDRVVWRN